MLAVVLLVDSRGLMETLACLENHLLSDDNLIIYELREHITIGKYSNTTSL